MVSSRRRFLAAALAAAPACLPNGRLKGPYDDQPRDRGDGWPLSTPAAEGLAPGGVAAAFRQAFSEDHLPGLVSLLVVANGRLVGEGYMRSPADASRKEAIMSATKSVTSLLAGIAADRGLLPSLDTPVSTLLPDKTSRPDKSSITLAHLFTMRSGIDLSNSDFAYEMDHGGHADSARYILGRGQAFAPGADFWYRDCDPHLMAVVLEKAIAARLDAFARAQLFGPLGIDDTLWLHHRDGTTYGAYGLYLRPRDLAKLGLLVLEDGIWQGQRLISQTWLAQSTGPQVTNVGAGTMKGYDYGHWWWLEPTRGGVLANGHGGQFIWIDRRRKLVVVTTAAPDAGHHGGAEVSGDDLLGLVDLITAR